MNTYHLIGHPLGHSLSPQIHDRLFQLEGIQASYTLLDFPPEQLETELPRLRRSAAFNITLPYKQTLLPYLAGCGENVRLYGSVNAIQVRDGNFYGENTDCIGFLRTLQEHQIPLEGKVCVLGAGGVGRMFALETARQGAQVTLAVRESGLEKARQVAREAQEKLNALIHVCLTGEAQGPFQLLINATPVGMSPKIQECPAPLQLIEQSDAVFDCIYNPSQTLLLRQAVQCGKQTAGGMSMLVWQAAAAHELWHGTRFSPGAIRQITREMERLLALREENT